MTQKVMEPETKPSMTTRGRTLDHVASIYDYLAPVMTFYQEKRLSEKAFSLLRAQGPERILDVGCGTGTFTIAIARKLARHKGSFVAGLDAAPKMIAQARKKIGTFKNVSFDIGIAESLPYPDNSFDAVISTFFFHHIDFALKQRALQEIRRVLKKGGVAVIVDVDVPTNLFGRICAWCGYILFRQEEIRENIIGKLTEAIDRARFRRWDRVSRHLGYISVFKLVK